LDERLRQRVLDVLLQRAAQRTRSVTAVRASLLEYVAGRFGRQADADLLGRQFWFTCPTNRSMIFSSRCRPAD
jgi:hypothetical protein